MDMLNLDNNDSKLKVGQFSIDKNNCQLFSRHLTLYKKGLYLQLKYEDKALFSSPKRQPAPLLGNSRGHSFLPILNSRF